MKIINTIISKEFEMNNYLNEYSACFIDIETTGLSRTFNYIYLIGILHHNSTNNAWEITQLLADNKNDEKIILRKFIKFIANFSKIITFNGNTFDIPFINERLNILDIDYEITMDKSFDIYKIIKENRYYLNLDSLKLKSLEEYLGIYRDDIYSGKDCIRFYLDYAKNRDSDLKKRILQHNYDDLYYMLDVMEILNIIKKKKQIDINLDDNEISLIIDKINISGDILSINGYVDNDFKIRIMYYDSNYNILFYDTGKFELTLECSLGFVTPTIKGYFIDKNKIALSDRIKDSTMFKLPSNILLVKIDKDYCMENIKNLMIELINRSLKEI
jgi:hypothetical protein